MESRAGNAVHCHSQSVKLECRFEQFQCLFAPNALALAIAAIKRAERIAKIWLNENYSKILFNRTRRLFISYLNSTSISLSSARWNLFDEATREAWNGIVGEARWSVKTFLFLIPAFNKFLSCLPYPFTLINECRRRWKVFLWFSRSYTSSMSYWNGKHENILGKFLKKFMIMDCLCVILASIIPIT